MAHVKLLLQGLVVNHDHETALKELLAEDADEYLLSVAFARSSGIKLIADSLRGISDKVKFYIGIANGVTSYQSLQSLLDLGIKPYVIDMGTSRRIYHPKIYAAFKPGSVDIILGSANMTYTGLNENIEASTLMTLRRDDLLDSSYIDTLKENLCSLQVNFPENVFPIERSEVLDDLLKQGRLEDEAVRRETVVTGRSLDGEIHSIKSLPVSVRRVKRNTFVRPPAVRGAVSGVALGLVWRGNALVERDLNIPRGSNTNVTGSMNFTKGSMQDIDQRHYFRDVVFGDLNWTNDTAPARSHLERAEANFQLVVEGIVIGVFRLVLTHNPLTDTRTYRQGNAMTSVRWGSAKHVIRNRALLGKVMSLYHIGGDNFQMVISE